MGVSYTSYRQLLYVKTWIQRVGHTHCNSATSVVCWKASFPTGWTTCCRTSTFAYWNSMQCINFFLECKSVTVSKYYLARVYTDIVRIYNTATQSISDVRHYVFFPFLATWCPVLALSCLGWALLFLACFCSSVHLCSGVNERALRLSSLPSKWWEEGEGEEKRGRWRGERGDGEGRWRGEMERGDGGYVGRRRIWVMNL